MVLPLLLTEEDRKNCLFYKQLAIAVERKLEEKRKQLKAVRKCDLEQNQSYEGHKEHLQSQETKVPIPSRGSGTFSLYLTTPTVNHDDSKVFDSDSQSTALKQYMASDVISSFSETSHALDSQFSSLESEGSDETITGSERIRSDSFTVQNPSELSAWDLPIIEGFESSSEWARGDSGPESYSLPMPSSVVMNLIPTINCSESDNAHKLDGAGVSANLNKNIQQSGSVESEENSPNLDIIVSRTELVPKHSTLQKEVQGTEAQTPDSNSKPEKESFNKVLSAEYTGYNPPASLCPFSEPVRSFGIEARHSSNQVSVIKTAISVSPKLNGGPSFIRSAQADLALLDGDLFKPSLSMSSVNESCNIKARVERVIGLVPMQIFTDGNCSQHDISSSRETSGLENSIAEWIQPLSPVPAMPVSKNTEEDSSVASFNEHIVANVVSIPEKVFVNPALPHHRGGTDLISSDCTADVSSAVPFNNHIVVKNDSNTEKVFDNPAFPRHRGGADSISSDRTADVSSAYFAQEVGVVHEPPLSLHSPVLAIPIADVSVPPIDELPGQEGFVKLMLDFQLQQEARMKHLLEAQALEQQKLLEEFQKHEMMILHELSQQDPQAYQQVVEMEQDKVGSGRESASWESASSIRSDRDSNSKETQNSVLPSSVPNSRSASKARRSLSSEFKTVKSLQDLEPRSGSTTDKTKADLARRENNSLVRKERLSKLPAMVKGFLTRRFMKTQHVQDMVNTIRETSNCLVRLHQETPMRNGKPSPQDMELHKRLLQQLTAAFHSFHDAFFKTSVSERLQVIATDRERLRSRERSPMLIMGQKVQTKPGRKVAATKEKPRFSARASISAHGNSQMKENTLSRPRPILEKSDSDIGLEVNGFKIYKGEKKAVQKSRDDRSKPSSTVDSRQSNYS